MVKIEKFVFGPLLTNCYLISSDKEAVLIDAPPGSDSILETLGERKLVYIILTHYHWDHTLGVKKLKEKSSAKILIHKKDKPYLKIEADLLLEGGEEIRIGKDSLKIIHIPGHSPGSIAILTENAIFVGDTIFEDGVGRTDLKGGSEEDLKNSLEKLKNIIKPKMKIYPGHGPEFEK